MSMVLTRSPLRSIDMNGAGTSKRRSARLSLEGAGDDERPSKRSKANGAQSTTVSTKETDGDANALAKRRPRKAYTEEVDGFAFKKGSRKAKEPKQPAVRNSVSDEQPPAPVPQAPSAEVAAPSAPASAPVPGSAVPDSDRSRGASFPGDRGNPSEDAAPKPAQKKARRRFPTTPEREAAGKPARRSKRLSSENTSSEPVPSPFRPAHAHSHANAERSPSPDKARPVTVEKKRKRGANGSEEEEKIMRIALPFQDTPVIKRNKDMRKTLADGHRRSSSGMRGQRASSLIDDGRGNEAAAATAIQSNSYKRISNEAIGSPTPPPSDSTSPAQDQEAPRTEASSITHDASADDSFLIAALPHAEVPTSEFFKHISADLTEPRRMRCLLGWCGTRALPPKPEAPKESTPASNLEFQALQAARVIQEELSQDLVSKGILSDWFSRDEAVPPKVPLRKAPNPRNIANAAKAEELERELERLKAQQADWDALTKSAIPRSPPANTGAEAGDENDPALSPLHPELLSSPSRAILEQLQAPTTSTSTDPETLQNRLRTVAQDLEYSVDQFTHGVHALARSRDVAEGLAEWSLADAAMTLEEREKARRETGNPTDALDALKALGKVLNGKRR